MKKVLIIAVLLFTIIIMRKIKTDNHNDGIICSFSTNIEDNFYNYGKLYASNISIKGQVQNYKKGTISAKTNLEINQFKALVDKVKNKNAKITIKRPGSFIHIFLERPIDPENDESEKLYALDFEIKSSKNNHKLEIIDDVIYVLQECTPEIYSEETEQEYSQLPKPFFQKVKAGFLHFTKKMSGFLWVIEKEEFIIFQEKKYKIIKPDAIVIHAIADDISLKNEGVLSIAGVKLEID